MTADPDALRAEIDSTRQNLSSDVNALTDYVTPANVAHRQAEKVKGSVGRRMGDMKDKVMGTTTALSDHATSVTDHVSSMTGSVSGAVSDAGAAAPSAVSAGTRGNPLAAGLIALGAGWLIASLLPASTRERQAAAAVKENASTLAAPLASAAKDIAGGLQQPAQEAVDSLKASAADAVLTVKDEGAAAGDHVRTEARDTVASGSGQGSMR